MRKIALLFLLLMVSVSLQSQANEPLGRKASLVVDANSGDIIFQESANKLRYPASLTKMMTAYMVFDALKKGKLSMGQQLPVSQFASSRPRTNLALKAGNSIVTRDALNAIIVKSANDAAVVLAEAIGGDETSFSAMMNKKARELGMKNTTFVNASGLHDARQVTTAYDMARLAIALKRDFPEYYPLFSNTKFNFQGQTIAGHNRVTQNYKGADGLKTGFIRPSGFNLVTSAERGNARLVGVVLGGDTAQARDKRMMSLLDQAFVRKGVAIAPIPDNNNKVASKKNAPKKVAEKKNGSNSKKIANAKEKNSNNKKSAANKKQNPKRDFANNNQRRQSSSR